MYSNVVDGDVHVGDRLTVVFDEVADGIHLPRFRRDQED
jgi:hypothetical protein